MNASGDSAGVGIQHEIALTALPLDERVWVPQAPDVWFRPLLLNTVSGGWCHLLRVRKSGILSRHRHPMAVVGYVIKGRWRYLEHGWIAEEGSFVYEPPGEVHTLTVPADLPRDEVLSRARSVPNVAAHIDGSSVVKEIVVPGRLVNLVTG